MLRDLRHLPATRQALRGKTYQPRHVTGAQNE